MPTTTLKNILEFFVKTLKITEIQAASLEKHDINYVHEHQETRPETRSGPRDTTVPYINSNKHSPTHLSPHTLTQKKTPRSLSMQVPKV